MEDLRATAFVNILQIFLRAVSFLTRGNGLNILLLMTTWRDKAVTFGLLLIEGGIMDKGCIFERSEESKIYFEDEFKAYLKVCKPSVDRNYL